MAVKFLINLFEDSAVIKLDDTPGRASISGAESIVEEILFMGARSYDAVGHLLNLNYVRGLDLYLFLVEIFDEENIEVLEGLDQIKADTKELGIIQKKGVT